MQIGLYFGSFNPIHIGHLIIANHILNCGKIEKIWFVVSPQNPFKSNGSLLKDYDRLHFVRLATEDDNRIKVSDIEFHLEKPSYTINTLTYLQEKYPEYFFSLIMGSDSFKNLYKWKNSEIIIKNYPITVYPRPGFEIENNLQADMQIADAPLLEISATEIRELIKAGKSIRYLVPEKVREEIEMNKHYKK
ncbi:MAG: nicotinate (nicotinamide) nucleotide adenylyltransferase [Bacteroidota bacterium]|nr:nicotinate (nicotinamide) nucleotide adenylyltransferase [Bacteroidota bacterium]